MKRMQGGTMERVWLLREKNRGLCCLVEVPQPSWVCLWPYRPVQGTGSCWQRASVELPSRFVPLMEQEGVTNRFTDTLRCSCTSLPCPGPSRSCTVRSAFADAVLPESWQAF